MWVSSTFWLNMTRSEFIDLVRRYESGSIAFDEINSKVTAAGLPSIDRRDLDNYWRSENVEDYADIVVTLPIADWQSIDDSRAVELISETFDALDNFKDGILHRNLEALSLRYRKTLEETSSFFIDREPQLTTAQVLVELKRDTVIYV